ncbi:MAG: glycosyltransferase family 2 protein [Nanoarchaeota archaeon]|nr:glycosyltransferase family 2 protein [Nanoarchaeota archaeon]
MQSPIKLSIIIPTWNEEKRLPPTLESYLNFFIPIYGNNLEIIIMPNNCQDKTVEIIQKFQEKHPQIKYKYLTRPGKGNAVIEGLKLAQGDLIGFVDADNSTRPKEFYDLVQSIKSHDATIASRWIKGAKINIKQPLKRRIASRGFNFLVRTLFGLQLTDTQCGAKLFKKQAIKHILPELGITEWGFDIDILYQLKRAGYKIREIPTTWYDSPDSRLKIGKVGYQMFLSATRLRLIYSPFKFIVNAYDLTRDNLRGKNK